MDRRSQARQEPHYPEAAVREWRKPALPNWWGEADPSKDPRLAALGRLDDAMTDATSLAWGTICYDREHPDPGLDPILPPLDLAALLREVAQDIEDFTAQA